MKDFKKIIICAVVNYKKWIITPRIYIILAIIIIFAYNSYSGMIELSKHLNIKISPWTFTFFLSNPAMFIIIGSLMILLFCNAPFNDTHMPFLCIRTGRRNWIIGQILYVHTTSLIFTFSIILTSLLIILPNIQFTTDWGIFINTVANNYSELINETGIIIGITPHPELIKDLDPISAMFWASLLLFLVTTFFGMLIFFFNTIVRKMSGIVASGILVFIAYFSSYVGNLSIGEHLLYFSPLSWSSLYNLDWKNAGNIPSAIFATKVLIIAIITMNITSVIFFCKKDLEIRKEDF